MTFARMLAPCLLAAVLASGCSPADPGDPHADAKTGHFFQGKLVWDTPPAPDFTLTDQFGEPFRLTDQRGKVVLIFFGYVQCPDVCPATLSTWAKVANRLGDARRGVRFVYVTVDPERDTGERLGRHLAIFGSDFVGLTGTAEELDAVFREYGITTRKLTLFEGAGGYVMEHTSQTFLVDPEGRLRLQYEFDSRYADVLTDVSWLLDQIRVEDVWSRPTAAAGDSAEELPDDAPPGVMYLSIANAGTEDDRLVSLRTDVCRAVEIHRTTRDGGRMRMTPLPEGVPIPAGETVRFAPGGLHVMLIGLRRGLTPGERFEVELVFASGRELTVESEVRAP
jgi:protein SCO1/2